MSNITRDMISIIRAAINNTTIDKSIFDDYTDDNWNELYSLANYHDLAQIVGDYLLENNLIVGKECEKKYQRITYTALKRYLKIDEELEVIKKVLIDAKIPFVLLKGSVIKKMYIKPWYRTSSDIDILVKPNEVEKAANILVEKLNYENTATNTHDIQLYAPSGVHLELHFTLIEKEELSKSNQVLEKVWDYITEENDCCYRFNDTMLMYYQIAHMAKHFSIGGCGIRSIIDIWVMQKSLNVDKDEYNKLLKESGLTLFSEKMFELANSWFGDQVRWEEDDVSEYIISGGTYGNKTNYVKARQTLKKGKWRYLLSRVFVSRKQLESRYPQAKKGFFVFVAFYIYRIISLPFKTERRKENLDELRINFTTNEKSNKTLFSKLGLDEACK